MKETKVIKPHGRKQEMIARCNTDLCLLSGGAGGGKTAGVMLNIAEYLTDPKFRATFFRKNATNLRQNGGIIDDIQGFFPLQRDDKPVRQRTIGKLTLSGDAKAEFINGARVMFTHLADESDAKLQERVRGWQSDFFFFDEATEFRFSTVRYLFTRNRGKGSMKKRVMLATNPDRESWVRTFIEWSLDDEGYIKPEFEGKVRYFYIVDKSVDSVVWGDTKEEVYEICKPYIDSLIKRNEFITPDMLIKSFTLFDMKPEDNPFLNKEYMASLANSGQAEIILNGCWNKSKYDESKRILVENELMKVFSGDIRLGNELWIVTDLATSGEDNMTVSVWDGLVMIDLFVVGKSTTEENGRYIRRMQQKYGISNSRVIYDATNSEYIEMLIPNAMPFRSNKPPTYNAKEKYSKIKDQCAATLVELIKEGRIKMASEVASRKYVHQKISRDISVKAEFMDEMRCIVFNTNERTGKDELITKIDMGKVLGGHRSPDIVDLFIMRMLPELDRIYESIKDENEEYHNGVRLPNDSGKMNFMEIMKLL